MKKYLSPIETKRIRHVVNVLLIIGIPFSGYRAFEDFRQARYVSSILLVSLCLTLLIFLLTLKVVNRPQTEVKIYGYFFFVFILLLGVELVYLIGVAGEFYNIPWFYLFPLIVFNIYGHRTGTIMSIGLLATVIISWIFFPLSLDAEQEILREWFVHSVVLIICVFFFAERQRYQQQVELILKQETLTISERTLNDTNILLKAENERREVVETELLKYKEQLEGLVKDRTSELERTNRQLVQEIKEREQTEAQRIKLENQLRQSQKMEAIGVLAGGIAHDFNNILGTMMGYSELLLLKFADDSEENDYISEIYQSCERAADLVSQILTFSRVEEPELKPVPFMPLLDEVIKMVRATTPSTIEILQTIKVKHKVMILANKTQIHQVIMNLCSNAAFAMRDSGGILELVLTEVKNSQKGSRSPFPEADSYLELIIKDTGSGIPSKTIERIFDPFFTTKEAGDGTGLGLSIVHSIVESHNGIISVKSKEEVGTVFSLLFPVIDFSEPDEEISSFEDFTGGQHILVVEDETALAGLYKITLESAGYIVTMAKNGQEALEKFRTEPDQFDLVFSDQIMPKMTGLELSCEVAKLRPDMPVILATGYDVSYSKDVEKPLNISHYLMKPVKMDKLKQVIGKTLNRDSKN